MITSMHIENFKCFKNFDIELGKFNVLVGPNDSGKTAFLEAIRLVASLPPKENISAGSLKKQLGLVLGPESVWRQQDAKIQITAYASDRKNAGFQIFQVTSLDGKRFQSDVVGKVRRPERLPPNWKLQCFSDYIGKASYYQFEPNALRKPSTLSQTMTQTGEGFPTFLDDISRADDEAFRKLRKHFCCRFSYYKAVKIDKDVDKGGFVIRFHTVHDENLPAEGVSDGVMLSLASIALPYSPEPPKILLIEEPENGVHYASLKEIVSTLQELSDKKGVQVIITTHSPYLLDLVEPEDVRVFWKDEKEGAVHAAKLSDYPEVEDLKKHFMTGEIWTEFDEADIVAKRGTAK